MGKKSSNLSGYIFVVLVLIVFLLVALLLYKKGKVSSAIALVSFMGIAAVTAFFGLRQIGKRLSDQKSWNQFLQNHLYQACSFDKLEKEITQSVFLSTRGRTSTIYINSDRSIKYAAELSFENALEFRFFTSLTAFIARNNDEIDGHYLAMPRSHPLNSIFAKNTSRELNSFSEHRLNPDINVYSPQASISESIMHHIVKDISTLNSQLCCIEYIGPWMLVYVAGVPRQDDAVKIIKLLQ